MIPLLLLPVPDRAWPVSRDQITTCVTRGELVVGRRVTLVTNYHGPDWDAQGGGVSRVDATFVGVSVREEYDCRPYVEFVEVRGWGRRGHPFYAEFMGVPYDHFVFVG